MTKSYYTEGTDDPIRLADEPVPYCEHSKSEYRARTMGLIYFIGPAGQAGPVKIGFTDRLPRLRLKTHQCGSPLPLELYVAVPGTGASERHFHEMFAADRLHGEWFRASDRLQKAIRILRTQGDVYMRSGRQHDHESPARRLLRRLDGFSPGPPLRRLGLTIDAGVFEWGTRP